MSLTITIDSPPDELVALASTPEGMARMQKAVLRLVQRPKEQQTEPEPVKLSQEVEALIADRLDRIESGELKESPWDSAAMRKRGAELLKREFGYEAPTETEKAA
jgi:hypothetical protein